MRVGLLFAALLACGGVHAMPLGLRTAMWGVADANRRVALDAAFPALGDEATAVEVAAALAGAADGALAANITDADEYAEFREWAKHAGAAEVKASDTAWMSFALCAAGVVPMPQDGDLVIDEVAVSSDGKLEAVFSLDGVNIGSSVLESRLKTVFGVEGAKSLTDAFSAQNIGFALLPTGDGRVRAMATPPADTGNSFFLRIKVKQRGK